MHKPMVIQNLCLAFSHKVCFENFSTRVFPHSRIGVIGRNGSGKSVLLKALRGELEPAHGAITLPSDVRCGYVPQVIEASHAVSGGQRFITALTNELMMEPALLLLDEPTNHLDGKNRRRIMKMLASYYGTVIIASHDAELLNTVTSTLWHIEHGAVHVFSGRYADYMNERHAKRKSMEVQLMRLKEEKKQTHEALMKEQRRAKKRKAYGEKKYSGDTLALKAAQGRGQMTQNKNNKAIAHTKRRVLQALSDMPLGELGAPRFSLPSGVVRGATLLSINEGAVGYEARPSLVRNINICVSSQARVAISGDNGSGKSTIFKAILNSPEVITTGDWHMPRAAAIGYLDQHYAFLNLESSVIESLHERVPAWSEAQMRAHLHNFLFRNNEELDALVRRLSGGEKARLSLALIAASTPQLLLLDEVTNNLDIETKQHVSQILSHYPAAMMVISHDRDFLSGIGIRETYCVKGRTLSHGQCQ